ncbi:hypothetical protein ACQJBY_016047 [Aegilops geniculata]
MVVGKPLLFAARSSPAILPEDFEGQRSQPIQPEMKNVPLGRGACAAHHAPTLGHVDLVGGNHLHVGVRMGEMASIMPKLHHHSSAGRKHLPQKRGEKDPSVRGSSRPHDELTDVVLSMGPRREAWGHSPRRAVTCAAPVVIARAAHDRSRGGRVRRKPWWRPHAPCASIRRPPRRPQRIATPLLRRELLGLHHRALPLLFGREPANRRDRKTLAGGRGTGVLAWNSQMSGGGISSPVYRLRRQIASHSRKGTPVLSPAPRSCQVTRLPRLHGEWSRHVPSNCHAPAWPTVFGARGASSSARLRPEANSARALGPGATVGVLGTRVPRIACLWPTSRSWYGPVGPS